MGQTLAGITHISVKAKEPRLNKAILKRQLMYKSSNVYLDYVWIRSRGETKPLRFRWVMIVKVIS